MNKKKKKINSVTCTIILDIAENYQYVMHDEIQ